MDVPQWTQDEPATLSNNFYTAGDGDCPLPPPVGDERIDSMHMLCGYAEVEIKGMALHWHKYECSASLLAPPPVRKRETDSSV